MTLPAVTQRSVRVLIAINMTLMATLAVLLVSGFGPLRRSVEPTISVERLNIVDAAGNPVLVLANGPRLPGARFHNKEYPQSFTDRGRVAGMLFYNSSGDEVGGLIYDGTRRDSGYNALVHLSLDQWQQSQVVALSYVDDGKSRLAGLRIWDRPNVPLEDQFSAAERMLAASGAVRDSLRQAVTLARSRVAGTQRIFVGSQNKNANVELRDPAGRVRARLSVDSLGTPRLQFLDSTGQIIAEYPARAP